MRVLATALLVSLAACADPPAPSPHADRGAAPPDTAMVRSVSLEGTAELLARGSRASTSVAVQTIDLWIARLDTAAVDGGAVIREDLGLLRGQLLSYPQDGPAIGTTMRRLGRHTAAVADSLAALVSLARALERSGARLGGTAPDSSESFER